MKLFRGLTGWQRLRFEGADITRLFSLLSRAGIVFWDAERLGPYAVRLCTDAKSGARAASLARGRGFDCVVEEERGGPALWRKLRRRRGLLCFLALCLALLGVSRLFIWQVDIENSAGLSESEIRAALSECGVDVGKSWLGFSQDLTRNALLRRLPGLRWATVNIRGCHAIVILRPRREIPACLDEEENGDLVAKRAAYVTEIRALRGTAAVSVGDSVQQGQCLVAGVAQGRVGTYGDVCALGKVYARTWYEKTAAAPLQGESQSNLRREKSLWALAVGKKRINFYKSCSICPGTCAKMVQEDIFALPALPLGLIRLRLYSADTETVCRYPTEQQLQRGLVHQLLSELDDGEILQCRFSSWEQDGRLYVTLQAECSENIAVRIPKTSDIPQN